MLSTIILGGIAGYLIVDKIFTSKRYGDLGYKIDYLESQISILQISTKDIKDIKNLYNKDSNSLYKDMATVKQFINDICRNPEFFIYK